MSLAVYPKYKDSGFDWLGSIPSDWTLGKFRHLFTESSEKIESEVYGEMLSVSGYRGIEIKEYSDENQKRSEENLLGYRIVHEGQLVVNTMWLNYAGLGISKLEGHVSPAYRSYWVDSSLHKPYVHHLMRSSLYVLGYTKYLTGVRPNSLQMGRDDLMSFPIIIPSISEQKIIANLLDTETYKIDSLIAEQEKLIELLKEKRQAVISLAVTKGLNPTIKMKASGVEWLGEIPEHWKIYRVKKLLSVLTDYTANGSFASLAENVTYQTSGYSRLVRLTDLRENLDNEGLYVDENAHNFLKKSELVGGEVLIANVGAYAGFACLMPNVDMKATLGPNMYLMKFKESLLSNEYALLGLTSFHAQEQLKLSATSTAQPKLNKDDVKEIWLALPTQLSEQNQILNYVNGQKHAFDSLIEQAKLGIELLQERRSALISAAVTGQIDLRNFQSRESHDS